MDKYEFKIKVDQIRKLVNQSDYETAMKIADGIDWRRVRSTSLLTLASMVYEKNKEYEDAKDILLIAYERAPIGKGLLTRLTDLALRSGNVKEAEAYYKEYCSMAGDEDTMQHLLRFLILEAKDAPVEQQIHALEQYCKEELDDKWLYRLAQLYQEAGRKEDCVSACDKIMLMFGIGKYVDKAMELKMQYAPLTKYQMDLVENREKYEEKLRSVEERYRGDDMADDTEAYAEEPEETGTAAAGDANEAAGIVEETDLPEAADSDGQETDLPEAADSDSPEADLSEAADSDSPEADLSEAVDSNARAKEGELDKAPGAADEAEAGDGTVTEQETDIKEAGEKEDVVEERIRAGLNEVKAEENLAKEVSRIQTCAVEEPAEDEKTRIFTRVGTAEEEAADLNLDLDLDLDLDEEPEEKMENRLMLVAADEEEGLALAKDELRRIHQALDIRQGIAKISGHKLNKKGVFAVAEKLTGRDLIVENAGDLDRVTLEELNDYLTQAPETMSVILVDDAEHLDALRNRCAEQTSCYGGYGKNAPAQSGQRHLAAPGRSAAPRREEADQRAAEPADRPAPVREDRKPVETKPVETKPAARKQEVRAAAPAGAAEADDRKRMQYERDQAADGAMDVEDFVQYACQYAEDIDCSIDGKSQLALYERAEMMEEDGIPLTKASAADLIERAADKAEKKSLFSRRYNSDGMLILKEKHFFD